MRRTLFLIALSPIAFFGGCGSSMPTTDSQSQWVAGFDPPALAAGYTRFVSPTVSNITPGTDAEYCQWVAAPQGTDVDILALSGLQSQAGHHALLYATKETNFAVGETHICTEDDMLSISFLGGVGAEGVGGSALPAGLYYRLPAGQALMMNTHWLNAGTETVSGQAVMDVQFAPASPDHQIADLFANNGDTFSIVAGQTTVYDNSCVLQQDLSFVMLSNHMHTHGVSAYSELIHADGTKESIQVDDHWTADLQFNPNWHHYPIATPLTALKGDTFHTHCEWTNDTSKAIGFPDEMCVGTGFYFPSVGSLFCSDGGWPTP